MNHTQKNPLLLFNGEHNDVATDSFANALQSLGIQSGDTLFISSRMYVVGRPNRSVTREIFLDSIIDLFFEAVGPEGTLIFPTYTSTFVARKPFHLQNTPTQTGALNERFRQRYPLQRSSCPLASVVAVGKEVDFYTKNLSDSCFGEGSVFDRLRTKKDAKFIFIGGFVEFMTFAHHIECLMKVPYRYDKVFKGTIIDERLPEGQKEYQRDLIFFVRDLSFGADYDHGPMRDYLLEKGLLVQKQLGDSTISMIRSLDLSNGITELLKKDPFFLIRQTKEDWEKSAKDERPNYQLHQRAQAPQRSV